MSSGVESSRELYYVADCERGYSPNVDQIIISTYRYRALLWANDNCH